MEKAGSIKGDVGPRTLTRDSHTLRSSRFVSYAQGTSFALSQRAPQIPSTVSPNLLRQVSE